MGIFATQSTLWTRYRATIQFRDKLMGGTPKDPKIIEGWLRAKAGIGDAAEVQQAMLRTLSEIGVEVSPDMTYEDAIAASSKLAAEKQTAGFKVSQHGLYIEARQIKAAIKETVNILYASERWGATKKGPKSFTAERVFVSPDRIFLGRSEPDGIELMIGHVTGPQGPRSTLGYNEYVQGATITFDVLVARDCIEHALWADIWTHIEENGVGALRSQGFGRNDIVEWSKLTTLLPDR